MLVNNQVMKASILVKLASNLGLMYHSHWGCILDSVVFQECRARKLVTLASNSETLQSVLVMECMETPDCLVQVKHHLDWPILDYNHQAMRSHQLDLVRKLQRLVSCRSLV